MKLFAAVVLAMASCNGPAGSTQPHVLLQTSGSGNQTTSPFTASRPWSIAWSFDCGADSGGSFFLDLYNATDHTPDFKNRGIAAEGEQKAADTTRFANPGMFYLEVTTTCAWTIRVFE